MAKKTKASDDEADDTSTVPANDAWTGMLVISFLALSIGTGFVAYEYYVRYEGKGPDPVPKAFMPGTGPEKPIDPPPPPPPPPKVDDKKDDDKKVMNAPLSKDSLVQSAQAPRPRVWIANSAPSVAVLSTRDPLS